MAVKGSLMACEILNRQPGAARNGGELAREANHRVANHLAILAALVQRHLRDFEKNPEAADPGSMLREIGSKIISLAEFHRHLAEQPDVDEIELGDFMIQTVGAILGLLPPEHGVRVVYHLDQKCHVPPAVAHPFGLLLSEIIMNSMKHAHPAGLRVVMTISCSRRDKELMVEIADDGIGLPEGFDLEESGGTGFRIIRALAKSADAQLHIDSDGLGLSFRFTLPASCN